jgi:S-adenosylmethionine-diacylgycerolhomoserine-N-methlytransferase
MDRIYRYQRHIYDVTRKPYLLGRDVLLSELDARDGCRVLEIGCGTGRNLIRAAQRYPGATFFGIDVSAAMLETARCAVARHGLGRRIELARGDAMQFDPASAFGVSSFDRIYLSYAISMIASWRVVLSSSLGQLAPGGALFIVDFGDQKRLPSWFKKILFAWLSGFHVEPREDLETALRDIAASAGAELSFRSLYAGYTFLARIDVAGSRPPKAYSMSHR